MLNQFGITEDEIKKYIRAKMDGKDVPSPLSKLPPNVKIEEPKIPTKEELEKMVAQKIPSEKEFNAIVEKAIKGKIPNIPYVNFIPPTLTFNPKTCILVDPFINLAKVHLLSRGGTMMVMAQYPPPAPPAPAIIMWQGYNVRNGPPIPPLLPRFPIPIGLGKFLKPEKGAISPEQLDKYFEEKMNPTGSSSTNINSAMVGGNSTTTTSIKEITNQNTQTKPKTQTTLTISGGQTITDKTLTQNNINKNKC